MRLTEKQVTAICESFKDIFGPGDHLWLFGSRVDDAKRGGDIDLYIETVEADSRIAYNKKSLLNLAIQRKIGAQKIDIVIKRLAEQEVLRIHEEARTTGILLV